jgi:hypothetical protein
MAASPGTTARLAHRRFTTITRPMQARLTLRRALPQRTSRPAIPTTDRSRAPYRAAPQRMLNMTHTPRLLASGADATPASPMPKATLSDKDYHNAADQYIDHLVALLEARQDEKGDIEVDYAVR